ncbi:hypothetical protein VTJ49DRAFT_210 [Mycothermus thermophilus]|uniref:G-patch domain-containing protein n=1 Tax=Humicola insolens TaxID=85995 RepID=A0ABR3VGJ1_HUMIN
MLQRSTSSSHHQMTSRRDANNEDDDYDDIPLQHQRPFGTGLHKKPIAFVSASSLSTVTQTQPTATKPTTGASIADLYLSMVLPDDTATTTTSRSKSAPPSTTPTTDTTTTTTPSESTPSTITSQPTISEPSQLCPICNLPLPPSDDPAGLAAHNASLAHQLCLPYSPPPSALDRTRMGLTYLSAHGWDPDARRGLGAEEQGIQFPLKPRAREERLGLGAPAPARKSKEQGKNGEEAKQGKLLDAKKVRKMAVEDRKRREEIREELFGDGRLEKYLGVGRVVQSAPGSRAGERRRWLGT